VIDQAHLTLDGLTDAKVVRLAGREAMNEIGRMVLDVLLAEDVDVGDLVDKEAIVSIADAAGEVTHFQMIVLDASHLGRFRNEERYRVTLAPPLARLDLRVNHEIFQDKTTQEIVDAILARAGLSSMVKWRLAGQYQKRTYTVQYGESEWAFIRRLLADEGINHWFDREGEVTTLVMGDHPTSHDGIVGDHPTVPYADKSGRNASSLAFHALSRRWSIASTKASVRDIDVQRPATPIDGEAGDGPLEVFEYPSNLVIPDAATARAKVRLEQHRRHASTVVAESHNARLSAGRVVEIIGAADDCFSGKFLITAVEHELAQDFQSSGRGVPYKNRVTLVPLDPVVPHRPAPPLPLHAPQDPSYPLAAGEAPTRAPIQPVIDGFETAVVTGAGGEEIHVDDLGRIKVRFFWDRSGVQDDKSSLWVRSLQMSLTGPMMLPRVGWEVPVVYENGNPDRPFVLGRLYNGGALTPYGMPGKKATSTLQSATSPKDGTTHEIRLSDDGGSEEAFVHATKDQTVSVGGSHTVKVSVNRTDDVQKSQKVEIDSAQTISVGGNQKVTVGADGTVVVLGGRTETIGGSETVGVTGTYKVAVKGGYAEIVGALYSLRCNQSNATIQGAFTQVIGAALSTTAGLGSNQSVAGARVEVVGGARSLSAGTTCADGTTGSKRITAGAAKEDASADMAINAGARTQISAGAAMSIQGGAKVVFEGATITVKAATLTAKGGSTMKLSGALKASAKVKLDAPSVKKNKKAEVEG
jgi:type VI secretion system secreted protein VgrG